MVGAAAQPVAAAALHSVAALPHVCVGIQDSHAARTSWAQASRACIDVVAALLLSV